MDDSSPSCNVTLLNNFMVKMENNKVKRTNNHQYLECKMHLLIETSAVSSNEYIYTYSNIIIIHHW